MNKIRTFGKLRSNFNFILYNTRTFSKDDNIIEHKSDTDNDTVKKETQENKNEKATLDKLNLLLQDMIKDDSSRLHPPLNLAKPKNKRANVQKEEQTKTSENTEDIVTAVKNVAQSFPQNSKQIESELLMKLLNNVGDKSVATTNLSDIIKDMKIDREPKTPVQSNRSQQVKRLLERSSTQSKSDFTFERKPRPNKKIDRDAMVEKINLFGSKPFGIFTDDSSVQSEGCENETWKRLNNHELKLAVTHPPSNYFQQMILWTEQGKVWKFPIDNEQGMEKEQNVYFAEHVFLEKHLESWCPNKGPLRHFMELVCVGLSKNPYLTVEAKREHIEWYKTYFEDKKQLLTEVGAIPSEKTSKAIAA